MTDKSEYKLSDCVICACAICHKDIFKGYPIVDQFIYKCGELSYISLAHKECAPEWEHNNGSME